MDSYREIYLHCAFHIDRNGLAVFEGYPPIPMDGPGFNGTGAKWFDFFTREEERMMLDKEASQSARIACIKQAIDRAIEGKKVRT